jgi:hypothetical protein
MHLDVPTVEVLFPHRHRLRWCVVDRDRLCEARRLGDVGTKNSGTQDDANGDHEHRSTKSLSAHLPLLSPPAAK